MSDLTRIEKLKLEKILQMGGGYVLDFSNSTFQEFIKENSNIDIFCDNYNYQSGSKANRLRALWNNEANPIVGELLLKLLEYSKALKTISCQYINHEEQELYDECIRIAERLRKLSTVKNDNNNQDITPQFAHLKGEALKDFDKFACFSSQEDKISRGLLLEKLLLRIFELYKIQVEKSFRRNEGGEQIDGAFKLDSWYYLVECKWTHKLTDIRQLDSLYGKINRSGKQTLGLFLSINGWSDNVCKLLKQNHDKSIVLMDGYDLRCVLDEYFNVNLKDLLQAKLTYLNIHAQPFYSVQEYIKNKHE